MANPFNNSTRFSSRCLRAALLGLVLGLAALCALFTPADAQSVQSMVKNQPFPYAQGVSMDTVLYKSVKAKLQAAEQLKAASAATISALQTEISATNLALTDQKKLGGYDARKADSLLNVSQVQASQLETAKTNFDKAQKVITSVLASLPRRLRKQYQNSAPEQIATAVVDYINLLQVRKWKWAGVSLIVGGVGSLVGIIILRK